MDKIENGRVISRPDSSRFLHLIRPFMYFQKNPKTGRDTGRELAGAGRKWKRLDPARTDFDGYATEKFAGLAICE